jgi:hypothetical protein
LKKKPFESCLKKKNEFVSGDDEESLFFFVVEINFIIYYLLFYFFLYDSSIQRRLFAKAAAAPAAAKGKGSPAKAAAAASDEGGGTEVQQLRRAKAKRAAAMLEREKEDLKHWGKVMLETYQRESAPYNALILSEAAKKAMWRAHVTATPGTPEATFEHVARKFGVSPLRARAVLVLQGIEQHRRESGRWVGDHIALAAALPKTVTVVDRDADRSTLDDGVAAVPARTSLALVRGEVDELELQRIYAANTLASQNAAKRAQRFPESIPPGIDFTVEHYAPASRRTLRGHHMMIVDTSFHKRGQPVDPKVAGTDRDPRFHVPMVVSARDGSLRTATLEERRRYYALSDRKPLSNELEPLEQLRKYVLTPYYYKGKPFMRKRFLEHEREFLEQRQATPERRAQLIAEQQENAMRELKSLPKQKHADAAEEQAAAPAAAAAAAAPAAE